MATQNLTLPEPDGVISEFPPEAATDKESVWTPLAINRSRGLTGTEKIAYSYILTRSIFHSEPPRLMEIAQTVGVLLKQTKNIVRSLTGHGLVTRKESDPSAIERLLMQKAPVIGPGSLKCAWCRSTTAILHEHHYPVPKARGGTQTVPICPNCHTEFHYAFGPTYSAVWPLDTRLIP